MSYDPITKFLDRFAWLAWFVFIGSLMLGFGTDVRSVPAGHYIGAGNYPWDVTMTVLCWIAAIVMLITQLTVGKVGNIWERISRWLMFFAQSVFAFRFTTMLIINDDIYAPPVTIAAFSILSVAQLLHCAGVYARSVLHINNKNQATNETISS